MYIFDFITQDEVDELPDDDPNSAFVAFVRIAQRRLSERIKMYEGVEDGWREVNEAQQSFMNIVVAAAKRFEIEPFLSMEVPTVKNFTSEDDRQFRADLDHYITQLILDNSSRARRDSVSMTPDLKSKIRTYIFHLRDVIEKSDDLGKDKREILLRRLREFEDELEKKRVNLVAVAVLAITFASAPGGIWASGEMANKLVGNIVEAIGYAKMADDATRKLALPGEKSVAITGPRSEPSFKKISIKRDSLDDEIPF